MYAEMAQYYDRIYSFKDYQAEVALLIDWIETHVRSRGRRLLDVACGTGCHLEFLARAFDAEGLDLSRELLACAARRNPKSSFHCADMRTFELASRYDVITCLFSSIGYMPSIEDLNKAVDNMARHLVPGGILLVEPWLTPEVWKPGTVHGLFIDDPDLTIARVNTSLTQGRLSVFDLHHLVGTPEKTVHFVEHHELGLYTVEEMMEAFETSGLQTMYESDGLTGRGLYIGVRAAESHAS
ncbi:class I SAM-dependent methyltransferase [Candidatus Bipolaricaulota bacterium]|jgi:SAM-dependent methyltransferase|nr:class I SAM-dependent methyltransferase [Candidatus Bipolaricaulota bacterium]